MSPISLSDLLRIPGTENSSLLPSFWKAGRSFKDKLAQKNKAVKRDPLALILSLNQRPIFL
jgi:hypothetical protein